MRFIHTADLHLKAGDSEAAKRRLAVLRELCAQAKELDALVVAGDLFDSFPEAEDQRLREAVTAAFKLAAPKPVLLIPGNHELLQGKGGHPLDGRYGFGEHVRLLSKTPAESVELGGVLFCAVPFQDGVSGAEALRALPPKDGRPRVAILHGTALDRPNLAMYAAGQDDPEAGGTMLFSDASLEEAGLAYAAFGHIHKRDEWQLPKGGRASYPGSPDMISTSEEEERSFNLVALEDGRVHVGKTALKSGTCAKRRTLWSLPGQEDKLGREAAAFIASVPAQACPVLYIRGMGGENKLREVEARISREPRSPAPIVKLRAKLLGVGESSQPGIVSDFLKIMTEKLGSAKGKEAVLLVRAARLGWGALSGEMKLKEFAAEAETEGIDETA
ncbi:MAG: metallophosphoesterase [Elusimicrobiota bacterium]